MKIILKVGLLAVLPLLTFNVQPTQAIAPIRPSTPQELIVSYASQYDTSYEVLLKVAQCESGFKHEQVVGDGGLAYGIFQYHEPTFYMFAELMGKKLDYKSLEDQIELTAYIYANYPELRSHWSCFK